MKRRRDWRVSTAHSSCSHRKPQKTNHEHLHARLLPRGSATLDRRGLHVACAAPCYGQLKKDHIKTTAAFYIDSMASASVVRLLYYSPNQKEKLDLTFIMQTFNTTHAGGNAQINNINGDLNIQHVYQLTPDKVIVRWPTSARCRSKFS